VAVSDNDGAAAGDLERRLATILSADVAAYSRLMAEDEEETLRVFRGHKEVFEKLVALHRGRIFNTAGDAILAEFGSAVEAVRCATEIQAALRTRNDQLPESRQVQFRIGVNLGDVMVQGHDLLGDGVNVAARLQSAAAPGGICIAGSVYDQIRNRLSLSFKPLGDMKYKNIPQAVRTFSIIEAEGLGELPSPIDGPDRSAGGFPRWLAAAAAALLLVIAGGGRGGSISTISAATPRSRRRRNRPPRSMQRTKRPPAPRPNARKRRRCRWSQPLRRIRRGPYRRPPKRHRRRTTPQMKVSTRGQSALPEPGPSPPVAFRLRQRCSTVASRGNGRVATQPSRCILPATFSHPVTSRSTCTAKKPTGRAWRWWISAEHCGTDCSMLPARSPTAELPR
jgi:class 3 adenylate cyclase